MSSSKNRNLVLSISNTRQSPARQAKFVHVPSLRTDSTGIELAKFGRPHSVAITLTNEQSCLQYELMKSGDI